jgi:large subunit ribosomal protein L26e
MVKLNADKTSSRRKMRKAHFSATSVERRERMASSLSADLKLKWKVNAMPIRSEDEVMVVRGKSKGKKGKVIAVYRKKYVVHVENVTRDKANGKSIPIGLDASNLVITALKMDKCRRVILQRLSLNKKDATGAGLTLVD